MNRNKEGQSGTWLWWVKTRETKDVLLSDILVVVPDVVVGTVVKTNNVTNIKETATVLCQFITVNHTAD